jgi:hypothetical protein
MYRRWTEEEEAQLEQLAHLKIKEAARILNRTPSGVAIKARKLGIAWANADKKYTQEEKEFIEKNSKSMRADEIAFYLGRSPKNVLSFARRNNIKIYKQVGGGVGVSNGEEITRWSPEEDGRLWELAERYNAKQISDIIGRTPGAVYLRCHKLGIKLRQAKFTNRALARLLGMSEDTFIKYKKKAGLRFLTIENPQNPTKRQLYSLVNFAAKETWAINKTKANRAIDELII